MFPGCTADRFIDAHHLRHWADGGATELTNLVSLCRHHHRLLHEGGFAVSPAGGALRFTRRDGTEVPVSPALPAVAPRNAADDGVATASSDRIRTSGVLGPLGACGARHGYQPLDLEHTMFCLMQPRNQDEMGVSRRGPPRGRGP